MIEFVNAPTPFLYGIHSGYQHLLSDMVSLDGFSFNELVSFCMLKMETLKVKNIKQHGNYSWIKIA